MTAVTVHLQRVPEGKNDYETVATLEVAADNTYTLDDPEQFFPIEDHVLVPAEEEGHHPTRVTFDEDPGTWARQLPGLLRTGYLVPVVIEGDEAQA